MGIAAFLDDSLKLPRMVAHVRREHLGQAILMVKYSRQMTYHDPEEASRTMDNIATALKVASETRPPAKVDQAFKIAETSIVEWADKVGLPEGFKEFENELTNARQRDKCTTKEKEKKPLERAKKVMEMVVSSNRKIDIKVVIWGSRSMEYDGHPMIPCSFKLSDTLTKVLSKVMQEEKYITPERNPHFYDDMDIASKRHRKPECEALPFESKLATLKSSNPTLYVLTDRPHLIFFKCVKHNRVFGNIVEIKGALFVKEVTGKLQQANIVHTNCPVNRIGRWGPPGSLTEREDIFEKLLQMATMSKSNWNIECLSILLAPSENVRQHKDDNQPPLHEVSVPHQRSRSSSVSSAATARPGTPGGSSTDDPRARTMSGTTLCDYSSIGDLSRPVSSASTAAKRSNSVPLMPTPGLLPGATGLLIGCHRNSGGTDSLTTQMNANSNGPSSSDDNGQLNSLRVDVEKVAPSIKDGERVSAPFSAPARGAQETRGWWRYIFG